MQRFMNIMFKGEAMMNICNEITCNRVNARDGEYYAKWCEHISDSQVYVSGGLMDMSTLIQCTKEILIESEYWGRYLEMAEFKDNMIHISIGS